MHREKLLRKQVESELKRRRYVVYTLLLLSIAYIAATIIFGERGFIRYRELSDKEFALKKEITDLKLENDKLRAVIESYGENNFYIEKHARENFGLAEPDEYIYLYEAE